MTEERLQILRMVEQGKVSAEEAAKLMGALGDDKGSARPEARRTNKLVRIRVREGDKTKVNVNVPLELARVALRFMPMKVLREQGVSEQLDIEEVVRLLDEGLEGKIVDIQDDDTTVEISVE